ncbi:hypothetical protein OU800_11670 [Pseudomonas sp. GOM7]|uniref:hypothetical protein n=1 Tax=Pseudomonas sp. GOM7 TaxID=2998079 RepID=UPI00227C182E|nr:hypothetical protein [Pseudomonas sp. GOM7]WAJ39847.1 hypothetical protein OU800_11670 [Pseudomonas sp. GOM7]
MHQSERNSRRVPVRENMPLQIRGWQIERVGWYGLLLLVALALAGLFSKGPLSDARLASPRGELQVHYQRFMRNGASSLLLVRLPRAAALELGGELLQGFSIESIQPQPASSVSDGQGGLVLHFGKGAAITEVSIQLKADGVGAYRSHLQAAGQRVEISQFIYP